MRLDIRHAIPCSPTRFWEMYFSPTFDEMQKGSKSIVRELLTEKDDGQVRTWRVRFTPQRTLPAPAVALLGTDKLTYEQENRWDRSDNIMRWRILPTILPGKVKAEGKLEARANGSSGCEMLVYGDIEVNVPFVGGTFEKTIVDAVVRGHEKMAENCRKWVAQHGA